MSTSYFGSSHDFQVHNLTITNHMAVASRSFEHLHDNIAADAIHNSDERCSIPNCYPETRKAVQGEIHSWITDGDEDAEPKKMMWLTGPAGAGKTAIAGSIAELCEDEGILAGSFFFSSFSGFDTRRTKRWLITTLAYCLLQQDGLQQLRAPILSAIERDPSIFGKSLSAQCKSLILKPLRGARLQLVQSSLPKVIVIDGLDEVEAARSRELEPREARLANEAEQAEVLSTLLQAALDPNFPFRILVVSRPEPIIRDFFSYRAGHLTREVFLDDKYDPDSDIALFLNAKFAEIRRRYKLSASWPGEEAVMKLRDNASGQFIYAATVVRFLQTAGMHPQARLDCILQANTEDAATKGTMFSSLDALYTKILNSSPDPNLSARWIGAIEFLSGETALFVRQLLQEYRGQAEYLLENLASLISIPAFDDDRSSFLFYHKSLADFFNEPERCGSQLYENVRHGRNTFLREHFAHILNAKLPMVPLVESEWPAFLQQFLRAFCDGMRLFKDLESEDTLNSWEGCMGACDVLWWVKKVDATYALRNRKVAVSTMSAFFKAIHYDCMQSDNLQHGDCRPLCRRWRSDIIRGCKALGWWVPKTIVLLRERMRDKAWTPGSEDQPSEWFHLDAVGNTFYPPTGSRLLKISSAKLPHAPEDDDSDAYESMCKQVDSLYSRLPEGWMELYRKEIREGGTPFSALQIEIRRIMQDDTHENGDAPPRTSPSASEDEDEGEDVIQTPAPPHAAVNSDDDLGEAKEGGESDKVGESDNGSVEDESALPFRELWVKLGPTITGIIIDTAEYDLPDDWASYSTEADLEQWARRDADIASEAYGGMTIHKHWWREVMKERLPDVQEFCCIWREMTKLWFEEEEAAEEESQGGSGATTKRRAASPPSSEPDHPKKKSRI